LEIISSDGSGFNKFHISLPNTIATKRYVADEKHLDESDNQLISSYLPEKRGTIVRIKLIRKNNHPSVNNTVNELNTKVGVIYYYFIQDEGLKIFIGDNQVKSIDPLFV